MPQWLTISLAILAAQLPLGFLLGGLLRRASSAAPAPRDAAMLPNPPGARVAGGHATWRTAIGH